MPNFWDSEVWSFLLLVSILLCSLLVGNILKKAFPVLKRSLVPTSVLGGGVLLVIEGIYRLITKESMFDSALFNNNGSSMLEMITYHALALGFIAASLKTSGGTIDKKRTSEIFNTGVTTVSTYLIQGIVGMAITMITALIIDGFFEASGLLLPFGFGQGTGQAMNYGNIYETEHGFVGGKSFGLAIAAMGFLTASIGGVLHLNIIKKRGKLKTSDRTDGSLHTDPIESPDEIPMQASVDKMTIQIALIFLSYAIAYGLMYLLGTLIPGMKSVIYGFNFLLGVLAATLVKASLNFMQKKKIINHKYTNNFLMTRLSNFFYDIMIVAGVAAIRLETLNSYLGILLILAVGGFLVTYIYNRIVAKVLFKDYAEEQFLAMYGMLTGTASTGIILLREIDPDFKTPASDNLVYQNFPAIVFGFPIMLLATMAPTKPVLTLVILILFFLVMNIILFRSFIFRKKQKTPTE